MTDQPITEAKATDSRLDLIQKLLNKAESTDSGPEQEALVERAADLMAKYGVTRAMLAESGTENDPVVDQVIWVKRPYAESMQDLLVSIATPLGAQIKRVKQFDPEDRGGRTKGAWQFGLRLFVHESDLARIEMLYVSLRNQAIAGASQIKGTAEFGQDQRAYRINYLQGFSMAIWGRLDRAEQAAKDQAQADYQELADKALLSGESAGRGVELVLADRRSVVKNAMHLALYGKSTAEMEAATAANKERWAEMDRKARESHEARREEQNNCTKCQHAKSGYCADHRYMRPTQGRAYTPSVGEDYYYDGHRDGTRADLGVTNKQVGKDGPAELS